MEIKDVNPNVFADIFGNPDNAKKIASSFGSDPEIKSVDLFDPNNTNQNPPTDPPKGETSDKEDASDKEEVKETADILGEVKVEDPQPVNIVDYYKTALSKGKFVNIEHDGEDGKPVTFIPKTVEELDEALDIQLNYMLDKQKQKIEEEYYKSKSPAWQAISKYADLVDDPSELVPFLQGIRNIQSVSSLNENELDDAEKIVRVRLEQRGEPDELIKSQIEALKTTDKLIDTAKQYKPLILEQEKAHLNNQMAEKRQQEEHYISLITDIRSKALKAIESPLFGQQKMTQEEKALVYDLIAEPSPETKGFGIYDEIDNLFKNGDFETLTEIALRLSKKDSYYNYLGTKAVTSSAADLQKKLRVAAEKTQSSNRDDVNPDTPTVTRTQFNKTPRFGK